MGDPWQWLDEARADVRARGLVRRLDPTEGLLDLASNDYLGLARHPEVIAGAVAAAERYGAGSTGSRLVTGTTALHLELEDALAARCGAEAALVFSSGYLANLGAVTTLAGPGTLVVSDRANHASLVDACRLARATVQVVGHADVAAVDQALAAWDGRAVVITDAVFSVDGTLAPLVELHEVVRRHGALLVVDEAHGLGVLGPLGAGACAQLGLDREPDVVRTVTLSKSLGAQGGAVLGPVALRDHLIDTARSFVFDTGLAPSSAGAALVALGLVTDERIGQLAAVGRSLAAALDAEPTPGAVIRLLVGDPFLASDARDRCRAAGVRVEACLRVTARADLSQADVERAASVVRASLTPPAG